MLCNNSIKNKKFPQDLKIAKVKPLFKNGSSSECDNYRPISLLPVISKVIEKVILRRLKPFMHDKYYTNQFGFRENMSTINACEKFASEILECFDKNAIMISVFIDLRKAFDSVTKDILLSKLDHYGIRGDSLEWFESYLTDRRQFTVIDGLESSIKTLSGCIAQGSILGPELFLCTINDLFRSLTYSKWILFADDTTIYIIGNSLKFLHVKLQSDLDRLVAWMQSNSFTLNTKKTELMRDYVLPNRNSFVFFEFNIIFVLLRAFLSGKKHSQQ